MPSYKIVSSKLMQENNIGYMNMFTELEGTVQALMNEGWTCVGGVSIASSEGTVVQMFQAMVNMSL
jgi:hypothetical protein